MRVLQPVAILFLTAAANAQSPAARLWDDLTAKREKLPSFHQEFEVTQTSRQNGKEQTSKRLTILDMSHDLWRERAVSGSGVHIRLFDGESFIVMEDDGDEFVRLKRKAKDDDPLPSVYSFGDPDWNRAKEVERRPCGLPGVDHSCVLFDIPLKSSIRLTGPSPVKGTDGDMRLLADTSTGLIVARRTVQTIERGRSAYQTDVGYALKRVAYGAAPETALFHIPSGDMHEVKELSKWNASTIKKRLAGKSAPALEVTDIRGNPVKLADFKGKTILLDFWTTWCPPCRADAPALDKLYSRYHDKELMILGISVSEDRALVEKYLKEHPHDFPVLLTTENEMPRPYQIGVFPTYMVIAPDGTLTSAVEGDQGFAELRKLLKKAGLDTDQ